MCEKRARQLKKGSHVTRLREARRVQRIQRMAPAANDESPPQYVMVNIDKAVQSKLIQELAWKTVVLMQRNKIIQQKIIDLQKETLEFVAAIMNNPNNPENIQRHADYMQAQGPNTCADYMQAQGPNTSADYMQAQGPNTRADYMQAQGPNISTDYMQAQGPNTSADNMQAQGPNTSVQQDSSVDNKENIQIKMEPMA